MQPTVHDHTKLEDIWHQVPADYYQQGVKTNSLQRRWHNGKVDAIINLIVNIKPGTILDVGSASGWFLSEIKKRIPAASCTGIDVYAPAIEYAKKHYPDISFKVADAHKLPIKTSSFDLVLCTEVLEHVVAPEEVVSEIERVLKPGGVAVIEMDSGNILFRLVWYWWTNLRNGVWKDSHIHVFNAAILEDMLKKSNMEIVCRKYFNLSMGVVFLMKKKRRFSEKEKGAEYKAK